LQKPDLLIKTKRKKNEQDGKINERGGKINEQDGKRTNKAG